MKNRTHYGIYGGQYVAETLMTPLAELERAYFEAKKDPSFQAEFDSLMKHYVGRESPLYHAERLSGFCGGAKILLKREDLNHTGAHKINNTIGQALLAKRMGKKKLFAETGAGMHGVATATVAALFGMECVNIILRDSVCQGVLVSDGKTDLEIYADETVIAAGRRGADWLEKVCAEHHIAHQSGTVDVGVRVEVRNEVMETVNRALYESKLIGYPKPFKNKVRTFCQNPGGFVSQENYDNDLAVVNGHSYKEFKSDNTNLAILCSHNFNEPFNQPIAFAQKVGELTNMLGAGHILVQRYGDILDGKRTWAKELARSNVRPTLPDAVAGDITSAMPYRSMLNIINFIQAMDLVVPGFAAPETLLYSPELKFYSNRIKMDTHFNTNVQGLHCLGDSSGWTRGLMMASVMGVLMGRYLTEVQ